LLYLQVVYRSDLRTLEDLPPSTQYIPKYKILPYVESTYDEDVSEMIVSEPDQEQQSEIENDPLPIFDTNLMPPKLVIPGARRRTPHSPKIQPYLGVSSGVSSKELQESFWRSSLLSSAFSLPAEAELYLPPNFRFLLDIYFSTTHSWLPFLNRSELLRLTYQYSRKRLPIEQCRQESGKHAVLWAVLAFSALQEPGLDKTGKKNQRSHSFSDRLYQISRSLLPSDDSEFDLEHAQALLVLSLLNLGRGLWSSAWLLIGQASRLAIHFGLSLTLSNSRQSNSKSSESKRLYYACFALDTLVSARLGRLPYLKSFSINRLGPLHEEGLEEWDPWTDITTSPEQVYERPSHILSIFNQFLGLLVIVNDSLCSAASEVTANTIEDLRRRLKTWQASLPLHCRLNQTDGLLPHLVFLHVTYLSTVQLLERLFESSSSLPELLKNDLIRDAEKSSPEIIILLGEYSKSSSLRSAPSILEYFSWLACRIDLPERGDLHDTKTQILRHLEELAETWPSARHTADMVISNLNKITGGLPISGQLESTMPPPSFVESSLSISSSRARAASDLISTMPMTPASLSFQSNEPFQSGPLNLPSSSINVSTSLEASPGGGVFGIESSHNRSANIDPSFTQAGIPPNAIDPGVDVLLDELASLEGLDW
jgi:hypothetical protein